MKDREITKLIASNIVDTIYDKINEYTNNQTQANAILSQIKILLK